MWENYGYAHAMLVWNDYWCCENKEERIKSTEKNKLPYEMYGCQRCYVSGHKNARMVCFRSWMLYISCTAHKCCRYIFEGKYNI